MVEAGRLISTGACRFDGEPRVIKQE